MTNEDKNESKEKKGLTAGEEEVFDTFKRAMEKEVIPEIVETVEKRRLAAAKNRRKHLKC